MCQFQELYKGEEGCVIRCKGCRHYQLVFGGVVLSMNESEFKKFMRVVAACREDYLTCTVTGDLPLPTMRQGVHLLLNQQKIMQLNAVLHAADAEAQTQSLLQLFRS